MDDPIWISIELVEAIHNRQIAEHGGLPGLRDRGLLESALARPRQQFAYSDETPDIASLAAAYAFGIARNHPFNDGNKRTSAVVCESFIELNSMLLTASDEEMYLTFLQLAEGMISEEQLADFLRGRLKPA